MKPPYLQTPLLICYPLFFLLLSPCLKLKLDVVQGATPPIIARPGCQAKCGNVSIPFPFGIGASCSLDPFYEITCNGSNYNNKKPLLSIFNIQIIQITLPDYGNSFTQTLTVGLPSLNSCGADHTPRFGIDLKGSPYNFSTASNVLLMEGCAGNTILIDRSNNSVMAGCSTICHNEVNSSIIFTDKCHGVECCQMPLPVETYDQTSLLQSYEIGFYGRSSGKHRNCLAATLIKNDSVDEYIGKLSTSNQYPSIVPVLLYWSWVSSNPPEPNQHGKCWPGGKNITRCECDENSAGNPYILNGCKAAKECKNCYFCRWIEENSSYQCYGGSMDKFIVLLYTYIRLITIIILSLVLLLLVFGFRWLYRFIRRRRKTKQRVEFFKLKLQQHQCSNEGYMERTKLFTHKVLDKATNHFNENRILGRGGQGTVYKGMLINGTIVAIKKSKLMDESQMEQFINEVVILSTINHRNVVKLLGCCLETEVPLLVYEFISNGTLSQHIHDPSEDFLLNWPMRLKIAADSAGAIAYLHSSSSTPVYHRDIKPCNILLDDKHRAKVSDFGSSKTIEIDQTHLTTLVQGTFGYLDPEYFESGIFTEKSDVYSFGIVLLELMTSKKPTYRIETMEQKVLVTEFFLHLQNSTLSNLLDPEVVKEATNEELIEVSDLAKRCLNGCGMLRPTMKEVAMTLEMIIKSQASTTSHGHQPFPNESFSGICMSDTSNIDFMSTPVPIGARSPQFIDEHPLLCDTI